MLWRAVTIVALLSGASVAAQEFERVANESLGIAYRVHSKLSVAGSSLGSKPRLLAIYQPQEVGDIINYRGLMLPWRMILMEFPKDSSRLNTIADNYREWVDKDPNKGERELLVRGDPRRGRGSQPDHVWWEFRDLKTHDLGGGEIIELYWYTTAAVYQLGGREVALEAVVPVTSSSSTKPDSKHLRWMTTMLNSLQVVDPDAAASGGSSLRETVLQNLRTEAATNNGFELITDDRHALVYSWDSQKASRKRDSERFAKKVLDGLIKIGPLFEEELGQHPNQVEYVPITYVMWEYGSFLHQSGLVEPGRVAAFHEGQVMVYLDKAREYVRNDKDLIAAAFEAAWQRYAYHFFIVRTPVDLHRWYEIGLAKWFGSHTVSGRRVSYSPNRNLLRIIRPAVQDNEFVRLETLLRMNSAEFDGLDNASHAAQAYTLVDFLKRGGEELGDDFDASWGSVLDVYRTTALQSRSPREAVAKVMEAVDLQALEAAWVEWVKNGLK